MLSSSQFQSGQALQYHPTTPPPLSLSSSTTGSAAQATAWRNSSLAGDEHPLALSRKTTGSTFKWDDAASQSLPSSDKGAGRNAE